MAEYSHALLLYNLRSLRLTSSHSKSIAVFLPLIGEGRRAERAGWGSLFLRSQTCSCRPTLGIDPLPNSPPFMGRERFRAAEVQQ